MRRGGGGREGGGWTQEEKLQGSVNESADNHFNNKSLNDLKFVIIGPAADLYGYELVWRRTVIILIYLRLFIVRIQVSGPFDSALVNRVHELS